jgi:hypothetical protein
LVGGDKKDTYTRNSKLTGDECNEKLMQSLVKKFGSSLFNTKECPQFVGGNADLAEKYKPKDCDSLYSGGASSPSEVVPASANITIDGWDVEKAVDWLVHHARRCPKGKGYCGNGQCATYVENAIAGCNGGGCKNTTGLRRVSTSDCGGGTIHATNLRYYHILEKIDNGGGSGFTMIANGDCTPSQNGRKANIELQAGDVAIIGNNAKLEGGRHHACMWSGSEWVSDYFQGDLMCPYGNKNYYPGGKLPYAIYRYHNKKGTPKS